MEIADLGWFERVLRPAAGAASRLAETAPFAQRAVMAGYQETYPRFQSEFSLIHDLLSSVR
jgi:hypothetical protein